MDSTLKQRLIGAAVLAALAIIFLPMLLKGPDVREPDAAAVPLTMPNEPGQEYETRELPLTQPEGTTSPGGVLGMDTAPRPSAPVDPSGLPVPDAAVAGEPASSEAVAVPTAPAAVADAPVEAVKPAPAPTVPTPSPTPAAAVAAGRHVVNIGSFANLQNAAALADRLRAAKLPVISDRVTLASGTAMRIRIGPYDDRAAAEAARLRAEAVTGSASKVVVTDADTRPAAAIPPPAPAKPTAPAAQPKPAPPVSRPVAGTTGFAVQLSAPSVESEAIALRDRARSQGFESFVQRVETDSGVRFRVRVGPVADRATAEAMRDSVNGKLGTKGIVVANP